MDSIIKIEIQSRFFPKLAKFSIFGSQNRSYTAYTPNKEGRMKRFTIFMLIAMIGIAVLASCSGSGQASSAQAVADGTITLKMVIWDKANTTYLDPVVQAYQARNPNVRIEFIDIPANEYGDKLAIMLAGGDDSDIISVKDIPMYSSMQARRQIEPLNAFINRDGLDLTQYSGITDELLFDGQLYALPFRSDFWILFFNKDIFDAAGVPYPTNDMTWDQYAALAARVSSGRGVDRVYGSHHHTWRSTVQLGTVQDGRNSIISRDYSFMKPMYEMIIKMQREQSIMDFASLRVGNIHYSGVFYNEQIAMLPMGTWFIATVISKINEGEADMNWGITKFPRQPGAAPGTTAGTITSLAINSRSRNKEAAWDFVQFFSGPEGAKILADNGALPAIRNAEVIDILGNAEGFPTDMASREALITSTIRLELPLHPKVGIIEQILNQEHELIITESVSIDQGLAAMSRRVSEALDQN
jgi:multiple sugar transport system substrate-binding protein